MAEERRRYTRIEFDGSATLTQGGRRYSVHLLDISLKGALIDTPEDYIIKTDEPATLHLTLAGEVSITMNTQLAHSSHSHLGFKCNSIDMESMTHLRRLIELNMEDPNACERVLEELATSASEDRGQ